MLEEIRNIKSKKGDLRNFGITIGIILITIAVLLLWKEIQSYKTFIAVGTLLCLSGFILPIILKPFFIAWMTFAIILGWFMTRLILALVFYGIMTPIGVLSRILGKKFLKLNFDKTNNTYWNNRKIHSLGKTHYEKQF